MWSEVIPMGGNSRGPIENSLMRRLRIVFMAGMASLFLGLAVFCVGDKKAAEICLEEIGSVGTLDDDLLFQWVGVAVDREQKLYVTDAMDYRLKKIDIQGRLLNSVGGRGRGPGQFLAPRNLVWFDGRLYVSDQYVPGLQVFDEELRYRRRIMFQQPIVDFEVISSDRVVISSLTPNKKPALYFLDGSGEPKGSLVYNDQKVPFMQESVSFCMDRRGDFYLAFSFQNRIEKWTGDGIFLWRRHPLKKVKPVRKRIGGWEVPTEVVLKDIALDSRDRIFVLGGGYSRNRSRDIYVYDSEGKPCGNLLLPEPSHCLYIDSKNNLYARANEGITLKKYRIIETSRQIGGRRGS